MENNFKSNTQNKTKFTNEDLKKLQAYDLDKKIALTLTRIAEFQAKFPHKIYILSFIFSNSFSASSLCKNKYLFS